MEAFKFSTQLILKMRSDAKTIFLTGVEAARVAFASSEQVRTGCSVGTLSSGRADRMDNVEAMVTDGIGNSSNTVVSTAAARHGNAIHRTVFMNEDVSAAAMQLHGLARDVEGFDERLALVCGRSGRSGRNEELALHFALFAERAPIRRPWVFLSGNTSGGRGSHKSAGAILDAGSCSWMRQLGIDPVRHAASGDPCSALAASGDLLFIAEIAAEASDFELILLA